VKVDKTTIAHVIRMSGSQYRKLMALVEAVKSMRTESLAHRNWYTFIACDFAEHIDDALKALEEE
jgi:hypothetical protein